MRTDFADERSAPWRQAIREIAGGEIPFVDLVADLRTLPVEKVDPMFIGPGASGYGMAEGQYSQRGHAFVASVIHRAITEIDAVKARLGDAAPHALRFDRLRASLTTSVVIPDDVGRGTKSGSRRDFRRQLPASGGPFSCNGTVEKGVVRARIPGNDLSA